MMKNWLAAGAVALSVASISTTAQATFVTQPGEQVGLAYGPLPEGVYAINTFSWGESDAKGSPGIGVNVPILAWATSWKVFGAQMIPVVAVPSVFVDVPANNALGPQSQSYLYNPFVGNIFAWNLGNNFSFGYLVGSYIGVGDRGSLCNNIPGAFPGCTPILPQLASTSIRNTFGLSYTGDGWNLTAALTHILMVDDVARFGGRVGAAIGGVGNADGLYIDLTATKTFDLFNEGKPKFEFGGVAYGYTDLPVNRRIPAYAGYQREGLFAVGGLVGYDFGAFKAQFMVTREVWNRIGGDKANETRGWFRIIAPLYSAPAPIPVEAPLVRKY
jgi:hypothetical protein